MKKITQKKEKTMPFSEKGEKAKSKGKKEKKFREKKNRAVLRLVFPF